MEKLLEIRVDHGEVLSNAVSVISKLGNRVLILVNNNWLSILVRDQENPEGKLIVILRLRRAGCSHYHFRPHNLFPRLVINLAVGISLAVFQEILNNVTEQDSVSISVDGPWIRFLEVDLLDKATHEHRNFPLQLIPYNDQVYPYNASMRDLDETAYRVIASIPSERFCEILERLRYDGDIDTHESIEIYLSTSSLVCLCPLSMEPITLKQENGEYNILGATVNDLYHLIFPPGQLNAFIEAASLSDTVFIHAHQRYLPLLNCPYEENDHGSLFFCGSYSSLILSKTSPSAKHQNTF